jgi:periplasmic copper chaperone A
MRCYLIFGVLLGLVTAVLSGCASTSLAASDAFSYACQVGDECAVYLTLTNPRREDDKLVTARTDVAARTEFHRLKINDQGVLVMQPIENVLLPAAGKVELKPGSRHIMLYDLTKELRTGDTFNLTLVYEKGGEETVEVLVRVAN